MPVPRTLADDIEKACNTSSKEGQERIEEVNVVELDASLEGATSFAFVNQNSQTSSVKASRFVAAHGNGAINVRKNSSFTTNFFHFLLSAVIQVFEMRTCKSGRHVQCLKPGSTSALPMMKVVHNSSNPDIIYGASASGTVHICSLHKSNSNIFSTGFQTLFSDLFAGFLTNG